MDQDFWDDVLLKASHQAAKEGQNVFHLGKKTRTSASPLNKRALAIYFGNWKANKRFDGSEDEKKEAILNATVAQLKEELFSEFRVLQRNT